MLTLPTIFDALLPGLALTLITAVWLLVASQQFRRRGWQG